MEKLLPLGLILQLDMNKKLLGGTYESVSTVFYLCFYFGRESVSLFWLLLNGSFI